VRAGRIPERHHDAAMELPAVAAELVAPPQPDDHFLRRCRDQLEPEQRAEPA
jgi:hypothetical protein